MGRKVQDLEKDQDRKGRKDRSRPEKTPVKEMTEEDRAQLRKNKLVEFRQQNSKDFATLGVTLLTAEEIPDPHFRRIPSGLLSMDSEIGGGYPCGGMTTLSGGPSCGKTYLCWKAGANVQEIWGEEAAVLYCTNEMYLAKDHARIAGFQVRASPDELDMIDTARLRRKLPKLTEEERDYFRYQIGTVDQLTGETAEALLEGLVRAIRSNLYHLIILDSLSNIIPEEELEEEIGENHMGKSAQLLTQFARKVPNAFMTKPEFGSINYTSLLAIKQVKANYGATTMRSPKTKEALGAHAIDHNRLLGIEFKVTEFHRTGKGQWDGAALGKQVGWRVLKGKSHCHDGGTGEFRYNYASGIDVIDDLVTTAIKSRAIVMAGAFYSVRDKADKEVAKFQGREKLLEALREDPGMCEDVREATLLRAGVECTYS